MIDVKPDVYRSGLASVKQRLDTGPRIHPSAWVAPGATVVGDVILAEEASVWFSVVLRGDINRIVIGPRSNIQDGAIIHLSDDFPCLIGELVTVGHGAIVHASTVDDEVLVGMGAIILDGTEIGARSIIGANSLVTTNTKIPPGSLVVGSPAKVVRQLSLHDQQSIAHWALKYVENAKHFREFVENSAGKRAS